MVRQPGGSCGCPDGMTQKGKSCVADRKKEDKKKNRLQKAAAEILTTGKSGEGGIIDYNNLKTLTKGLGLVRQPIVVMLESLANETPEHLAARVAKNKKKLVVIYNRLLHIYLFLK